MRYRRVLTLLALWHCYWRCQSRRQVPSSPHLTEPDCLLGAAVVDGSFVPALAWLAFLHVSRRYRRRGVASARGLRQGSALSFAHRDGLVRPGGSAEAYVEPADFALADRLGVWAGDRCPVYGLLAPIAILDDVPHRLHPSFPVG